MPNVKAAALPSIDADFYPTPPDLVDRMLLGIDAYELTAVLEPSAGRGDILNGIDRKLARFTRNYGGSVNHFDIDAIEIDPNLRAILKERFHANINSSLQVFHIVHDDFLTFEPIKEYSHIIMNPPFSNGDVHLLKAIDVMSHGGKIICLLNAETIRNPYTPTRKILADKLNELEAEIEYIEDAFKNADRPTDVEVALIRITIPQKENESYIWEKFQTAEDAEEINDEDNALEVNDFIKAAIARFNHECRAGVELIRQYRALVPYLSVSFSDEPYSSCMLQLADSSGKNYPFSVNGFLKEVRQKYWNALLANPKFVGKLTSELQKEYRTQIGNLSNYDFNEFNINVLAHEMNAHIYSGIKKEIVTTYDRLTAEHTWYPETARNKHYYDGWITNKATYIGKKVIIPCYGVYSNWDAKPSVYEARNALEDIERVLNYLDGEMTKNVDIGNTLKMYFETGVTKRIPLKYFKATFYKKGTVHIEFTCPELIDRYNIYIGKQKNWLPPCYGKKHYADMDEKERAVVDSFNGTGAEESGKNVYDEICSKAEYYLCEPTSRMLALGTAHTDDQL